MYDVVTFGEAMLRLSPPHFARLEQTHSLDVEIGGSELNVAVGVSRLGMSAAWISKLPSNALGRMVRNRARELGVDVSHVIFSDHGRQGLYFVEYGAAPRASSVLYDRANSSISLIQPGEVDWKEDSFQGQALPRQRDHPGAQPFGGRDDGRGDEGRQRGGVPGEL